MIIPDTSVWIEYFKKHEPIFSRMQNILENQQVLAVECIFGELLQGCRSEREKTIIVDFWTYLPRVDDNDLIITAGIYSYKNKLISKGVGLIDAVIISASQSANAKIWTLDKKLKVILSPQNIFNPQ
jgi:predicted nucleic acid-binding protein